MNLTPLRLGYLPLIDAAPLVVAHELGFAAEEGLGLDLVRQTAWAQSRDMLGAAGSKVKPSKNPSAPRII